MVAIPRKSEDASQLTVVANSVSHLARLVSDLQSQLTQLDARLSSQETESLANYNQKKREDFKDAYKGLVSIVRTLKNSPEIKEAAQKGHENSFASTGTHDLLRKIAVTLNDVDTVASCVSNDDLSIRGGVPQAVQFRSNDVDAMQKLLQDKEHQMEVMRKENDERLARLEKELQRRSKGSVWKQFFPVVLVLGSFGIANKEVINPTNLFTSNPVEHLKPMNTDHHDMLNFQPSEAPKQHEIISSVTTKETISTSELTGISHDDEHEERFYLDDSSSIIQPSIVTDISPHEIVYETQELSDIVNSDVASTSDTTKCWSSIVSEWLESNLCQELSDMMICRVDYSKALQNTQKRNMMPSQLFSSIILASVIPSALTTALFTPTLFSSAFWKSSLLYLSKLVQ